MQHPFDWLTQACRREPTRTRFTYLADDGSVVTYGGQELIERSKAMAQGLRQMAKPGERVLLAYPAGVDFVIGFLACVKADLLPVPANYPKPRRPLSRYQSMVDDCDAHLALTAEKTYDVINPASLSGVTFHTEATLADLSHQPAPDTPSDEQFLDPNRTLFLQYTSGSTSQPLGVCISQANLAANLTAIYKGFQLEQITPQERIVCSWLPAYHDMGLVGVILSALVHDGHAVMMSPAGFSQRPARWLAAMTEYKARVTVAPNFGYAWATAKVDPAADKAFDLSHLFVAGCGAEPIDPQVLRNFGDRFGKRGFDYRVFYPCYGLAESTLMVTGAARGQDGAPLPGPVTKFVSRAALREGRALEAASPDDETEVVSSGVPANETLVVIADPATDKPCPEGVVGEVRVHSPSVATAYWDNHEATERRFRAASRYDSRVFLHTGDLGYLSNGELYITGRLKDMLVVRGQNHYPQDIERTVRLAHPMISENLGAAFLVQADEQSLQESGSEDKLHTSRLVIVQETPRSATEAEQQEILRAIRLAVASEHDLAVDELWLIPPALLPRTSSGKVQRFRCCDSFLQGELRPLATWKHQPKPFDRSIFPDLQPLLARANSQMQVREQITESLLTWLSREGGVQPGAFDRHTSFAEFGIDSVGATELSRQMEQWLQEPLSPVLAWSYPNVEKLAEHLTSLLLPAEKSQGDEHGGGDLDALLSEIEGLEEDAVEEKLGRLG